MQILDKYSIDIETFNTKWATVRDAVFERDIECKKIVTQPIFKKEFEYAFISTGYHFYRNDFESFNAVLEKLDEREFVICNACKIEDDPRIFEYKVGSKFKEYSPKWVYKDEGFLNTVLRYPFNHLIFGERSDWGLFCSEPYDLIIIGFDPEIRNYFLEFFPDRIEKAIEWLREYDDIDFLEKFRELYGRGLSV